MEVAPAPPPPNEQWSTRLRRVEQDLDALIPRGSKFILVDDAQWGHQLMLPGREAWPFLERGGTYWGPPPDDETAIRELQRLREGGVAFVVFGWPSFWWLDHFSALHGHLRSQFRLALDNDSAMVFDLRGSTAEQPERHDDGHLNRPNDAAEWETVYMTPLAPAARTLGPPASVIAELTKPCEVVLEAGCGSGQASAELSAAGRTVELCDFSQPILNRAAELFRVSNLSPPRATLCDITRPWPWADGAVDVVWSSGVLEHWTDEELAPIVAEMARVSRRCVISLVPYAGCLLYRLGKHLAESAGRWPYGRELPRHSLRTVFERAGLARVHERTVWAEWAPRMLALTDPKLHVAVERWWDALAADDPVKQAQGYLLLTVGYVDAEARGST